MASDPEKNVIRRIMTEEEVICGFMEPKPEHPPYSWQSPIEWGQWSIGGWWWPKREPDLHGHWEPRRLTLDALWEVEERMTREQKSRIGVLLYNEIVSEDTPYVFTWHATAAQKIKALAAVLRNGEKPDGK